MFRIKISVVIFLSLLIAYNFYASFRDSELNTIRRQMNSVSVGERYYGHLNLWYYLARNQQWEEASKIEKTLDPVDIKYFYSIHHPLALKKTVNHLVVKDNKTADDYVELARIQILLGMTAEAKKSLQSARDLDPIRDDISQAIFISSLLSPPLP